MISIDMDYFTHSYDFDASKSQDDSNREYFRTRPMTTESRNQRQMISDYRINSQAIVNKSYNTGESSIVKAKMNTDLIRRKSTNSNRMTTLNRTQEK